MFPQCHILLTRYPTKANGRTDGLIDHRFLQSRNFPLVLSVAFIGGMLFYKVNASLPVLHSSAVMKLHVLLDLQLPFSLHRFVDRRF